jgi:pimeloyl-ACP methyl ester carboxylesterase
MAPVARGLADSFRVIEPFQSADSTTVAAHVADLHDVVSSHRASMRPALVGHSWGAMLALAYAAAHPQAVGPIVLVASGTFDLASRARYAANMDARMDAGLRAYLPQLEYVELERCGHYPWLEKSQLYDFFPLLKSWLARNMR